MFLCLFCFSFDFVVYNNFKILHCNYTQRGREKKGIEKAAVVLTKKVTTGEQEKNGSVSQEFT